MPGPALTFPMQLDPVNRRELEALLAQLNEGFLFVEHNEDGTHSDIHANSITLVSTTHGTSSGVITLVDQSGREITLSAEDRASPGHTDSVLRVESELPGSGVITAVDVGYLKPHPVGYTTGPGIFLREHSAVVGERKGWTLTTSNADVLLTGRSMLAITDTVENKGIFAIRPVGAEGFVSEYVFGPLSGGVPALGTPISLGRESAGERWDNVSTRIANANEAVIIGGAFVGGVRLDRESAALALRVGDDSAYADLLARSIISTSGYLQSQSSYLYLGAAAVSGDVLVRKLAAQTIAVRLGDDSDYGDLYCRSLVLSNLFSALSVVATSYVQSPIYIIGTADTNGARLTADANYVYVREGDDSAYTGLAAGTIISTSGYVQSASSYYYFGQGIAADVLMRKIGTGVVGIRLGDDSDYADLAVRFVHSTSSVQADTSYYLGPATTSGALLKLVSGTPTLREGDDSANNDLVLRDLGATGNVNATGTVSGATVTASGTVNATTVTATGTVSGTTVTGNQVGAAAGSAGAPSFYNTGDPDSGIYFGSVSGAAAVAAVNNSHPSVLMIDQSGTGGFGLLLPAGSFGAGAVTGCYLEIGNNLTNSSAAGTLRITRLGGTVDSIWPDNTGLLRISTAPPEEDGSPSDTSGTIVGTQSSRRAVKNILQERTDYQTCLGIILDTRVYDFTYKDGRYNNEQFTGIVADDSPVFAMDDGKVFNPVTAFGILVNAVKAQQTQIEDLQSQIDELKAIIRKWA